MPQRMQFLFNSKHIPNATGPQFHTWKFPRAHNIFPLNLSIKLSEFIPGGLTFTEFGKIIAFAAISAIGANPSLSLLKHEEL